MSFEYQPFLISNLRHGLEMGLKPWLAPEDAFSELVNAYLDHGVLYKRKGRVFFGRLVHEVSDESYGAGDGGPGPYEHTLGTLGGGIAPGTVTVTADAQEATDDGEGGWTGADGSIDYATGECSITFGENVASEIPITVTYSYYPDLPCMGIFNYTSSGGSQDLLAFNTKRVNKYNETTNKFEDIAEADLFTGYDYEYFWLCNWLNKGFMTNGRDQIQFFDGLDLTLLVIDLDADADNDLDSAYLIFPYKDRLVFLRTGEFGTLYPQRARWTKVGYYDESEALAFVDAPTHEWIMGAGFIRNELVVFFERSVWLLRYTGDSRLPFRWVRIAPTDGLMAKMGLIDFNNELVGIGPTQLFGTDASETYSLDEKVPNLVMEMNQAALAYCYASALDELSQMWMSYASLGATLPDEVLVLNYEEKSFSIYRMPHLVTGYYQENEDLTWDDIEETWDEIEWAWDDRTMQAGYPITLGGDHQGYIWKLNYGGSDNGEDIEMIARTGRWNPFIKKGQKVRLGWVDFLVDRDPLCHLQVDYYLDHEKAAYMTDVLTLDDGTDADMIWVRSYVGCEAQFHQLRLYNKAVNQTVVVHAMMPWFAPAGRIN